MYNFVAQGRSLMNNKNMFSFVWCVINQAWCLACSIMANQQQEPAVILPANSVVNKITISDDKKVEVTPVQVMNNEKKTDESENSGNKTPEVEVVNSEASAAPSVNSDADKQKILMDRAIKESRASATGKLIKSAEPFGFWQDPDVKPQGLRPLDLSVSFIRVWIVNNPELITFFDNIGYKTVNEAKQHITEIGRYGRRIVITCVNKEVKRNIFTTINSKLSHIYRVNAMEDDDVAVNLSNVPHDMKNEDIAAECKKYGTVTQIIQKRDDLGFLNNIRTVMISNLEFDLPSYVKVKGYTLFAKYHGQPETCRICNRRHMAEACPEASPRGENTPPIVTQPVVAPVAQSNAAPAVAMDNGPSVPNDGQVTGEEGTIKALYDTIRLLKLHPGSAVNSEDFVRTIDREVNRLAHHAYKRCGKVIDTTKHRPPGPMAKNRTRHSGGYNDRRYGKRTSEHQHHDNKKQRSDNDGFKMVGNRGRGRGGYGRGGQGQSGYEYNWYDHPDLVSANSFGALPVEDLQNDLRMSGESGDEGGEQ